ncbi:phage antirepressor KilAC domain-containing protein [Bacillus sp. Gen3]|nr:phage antirepressor KilAC domain-containing protein [Bacillus sp. Gen3]
MNQLVFIENGQAVTDSLTVSEVFGKKHKNVLADIENQIEKLIEAEEDEFSRLNFQPSTYENERGREYRKYNLTEDAFTLVAMSYVTPEAMKFKVKFIQEFKRMKATLQTISSPSYMIEDEIERAQKWIEEQKHRLMLEQQIKENAPKITYYDTILKSKKLVTVTQIAKDYGLSAQALNKILHEKGIQYKQSKQWFLYSKYQDKGYTKSETSLDNSGEVRMNTKWTQKGRLFIHEILTGLGYDPDKKIA